MMETLAKHVKGIPGRKNLLWVSEGFPLLGGSHIQDNFQKEPRLAAAAVNQEHFQKELGLATAAAERCQRLGLSHRRPRPRLCGRLSH